jgi:putative transposase
MHGEIFHVMSRAIEGQLLFCRDSDYRRYLGLLQLVIERHGWSLHTFALMPNHVHLEVAAPRERLSAGLWWLHWSYAEHYKRTYRPRLGHVFGQRPKCKPITDDAYYVAVARYIALNPVGPLVESPEDYRWSAHRALVGKAPPLPLLTPEGTLAWFGSAGAYERFVTGVEPAECGAVRRWAGPEGRPALAGLLADPSPSALLAAHDTWGYTVRAIADAAGMSRSTVQRRIAAARGGTSGQSTCLTRAS